MNVHIRTLSFFGKEEKSHVKVILVNWGWQKYYLIQDRDRNYALQKNVRISATLHSFGLIEE